MRPSVTSREMLYIPPPVLETRKPLVSDRALEAAFWLGLAFVVAFAVNVFVLTPSFIDTAQAEEPIDDAYYCEHLSVFRLTDEADREAVETYCETLLAR